MRGPVPAVITCPDPGVNACDVADETGLDQFDHAPVVITGMDLCTHLRDDLVAGRGFTHKTSFLHGMGQRFFTVDMFAVGYRKQGCWRVMMVRCSNDDRIDLLVNLVDHFAIIAEFGGLGKAFGGTIKWSLNRHRTGRRYSRP